MEFFIILLLFYVLPIVLGFIIYYIHWSKNDEDGCTIEDMNLWMTRNVSINNIFEIFIPLINWAILVFAISDVFGDSLMNLRIKKHAKSTKTKGH